MEDDATLITREHYMELLIDASFKDTAEIESEFMGWCERHVPVRREQRYDKMWVRQRIEMAQTTRNLHRKFNMVFPTNLGWILARDAPLVDVFITITIGSVRTATWIAAMTIGIMI